MPLPRKVLSVLLAACLCMAQVQAFAHGVAHLASESSFKSSSPTHTPLCADCAAFAQAGAGPVSSGPRAPAAALSSPPRALAVAGHAGSFHTAYQSRAPPAASM
jgi:hypothetical protein